MRIIVSAVLLAVAAASCRNSDRASEAVIDAEPIVPVGAQTVETGRIRHVIHATGIVTPAPGAEFLAAAPVPATVAEVAKREGDPVASGEVVVRLDIPSAAQDAARQRNEAARAQALLENARANHTRARELFERGIISRRELENAEREVTDAQSAVAQAEVAQAAAEAAAARAIIRAPFNGIVVRQLRKAGELVNGTVTDPILRIVDPSRLEVAAVVPSAEISYVLPGASARIASAGAAVPVRLTVVSRAASNSTDGSGNAVVRLAFAEPTTLAVETPVEIDIDGQERTDVVLIPATALVREGTNAVVFVAAGDRATRRPVTTGLEDEERVEITAGLQRGELLITRGHSGLTDGARISVITER